MSLKNTGHEKVKISICLSARADGTKLKHFIVLRAAKRASEALIKEFGFTLCSSFVTKCVDEQKPYTEIR